MDRGRVAGIVVIVVIVAACQPSAVSPSTEAAPSPSAGAIASPPGSPTASESPEPDVSPTIDPDWITRPALTCGDPGQLFPPEALDGPGLAELGPDPAAGVLRSTVADAPPEMPLPERGWHRVADTPGGVTFVAPGDGARVWWVVTVGVLAGTLQAIEYGACHLAIAAPSGVSYARWWLDPDGPPITPETTTLAVLILEQECASGKPPLGRVLAPTIVTTDEAIEITVPIRQQLTGQDCPGNPPFPLEIALPEPIGSRGLFDASEFPPRPATTTQPD
jgi:hypothetical protein